MTARSSRHAPDPHGDALRSEALAHKAQLMCFAPQPSVGLHNGLVFQVGEAGAAWRFPGSLCPQISQWPLQRAGGEAESGKELSVCSRLWWLENPGPPEEVTTERHPNSLTGPEQPVCTKRTCPAPYLAESVEDSLRAPRVSSRHKVSYSEGAEEVVRLWGKKATETEYREGGGVTRRSGFSSSGRQSFRTISINRAEGNTRERGDFPPGTKSWFWGHSPTALSQLLFAAAVNLGKLISELPFPHLQNGIMIVAT